ncbi:hypothetical protein [Microbacterium sp. MYb66]|uniref:hypothetical protein n=1 Tax=Microbacterium sp. MYb66 TaxID=1848692 RepID=UPI002157FE3A|nr:hypothetical protein [Microbacterium sp. MYb66]
MNDEVVVSNMPKVLYHYTAAAGLAGILESSTIWATDIHYLNDYTELVDSKDRLLGIMRSLAKSLRGAGQLMARQFVERIEDERWPDPAAWRLVTSSVNGGDMAEAGMRSGSTRRHSTCPRLYSREMRPVRSIVHVCPARSG